MSKRAQVAKESERWNPKYKDERRRRKAHPFEKPNTPPELGGDTSMYLW